VNQASEKRKQRLSLRLFNRARRVMERMGRRKLKDALQRMFGEAGIPGIVKAHEKFFVSLAHTDEDVEITLEALASAMDELSR
jgi:glutamate-1-semialdehyde aminotransferase